MLKTLQRALACASIQTEPDHKASSTKVPKICIQIEQVYDVTIALLDCSISTFLLLATL